MTAVAAVRADVGESVRALLAEGDLNGAATATLEAFGPGVLGYLHSMLPEDDALDAFSSWQEDVWRGLPGFLWKCSLRAWVYRLAWHAAARLMRDAYRRRREPLPTGSGLAVPAPSASGLGGRREALEQLRGDLLPEERTLLALRVGRELEWDEVSAVLAGAGEEISSAALRKRFERLKAKLAVLAAERGLLDGAVPAAAGGPGRARSHRDP